MNIHIKTNTYIWVIIPPRKGSWAAYGGVGDSCMDSVQQLCKHLARNLFSVVVNITSGSKAF